MDKGKLEELLAGMVRSGATALHLLPGQKPCMRLQGSLVAAGETMVSAEQIHDLTKDFLFQDLRARIAAGQEVDLLFTARSGERFRTRVGRTEAGFALHFRRVPREIPSFADLGVPEILGTLVSGRAGLVLITGFLGSGRSTTLAAMVDRLSADRPAHVVTLEQPSEFVFQHRAAIVHQREVGLHVPDFATGVREAMQQSADVVVVADVADAATFDAMLDAAESGLLVLGTLHASSVVAALRRLDAAQPAARRESFRQRLAASLRALLSQTLLPRSHGTGRVPLLEILLQTHSVAETLRAGDYDALPAIMAKGRGLGMQTTDIALRNLLNKNLISMSDALYHASDRESLTVRPRVGPGSVLNGR